MKRFGTAPSARASEHFKEPRGEFVLVIDGAQDSRTAKWTEDQLLTAIHQELEGGEMPSAVAAKLADRSGWRRREIYALTIKRDPQELL